MEKKGNLRNGSVSSRGTTTESKKNQDVSGKVWPRGSRRREPTGASLATSSSGSKSELSRKPQPQRIKSINDKRPKPRGYYYGSAATGRNETPCLEEDEAELGSVFVPGSKKQSLNHLLNFSFVPRESYQSDGRVKTTHKLATLMNTKKHKYNKEHFLQANCQFVVNDSGDYKRYLSNPDALVDWNLIEQVNVLVSEFPSCPICLYPPVAAKMTRCGHIYCWSCILHYLALSEKQAGKCPICFDGVHIQDLKSVVAIPHTTFNLNDTITFKLMKRPRGCLTAYPVDADLKVDGVLFNVSEQNVSDVYSKLLLAGKANVLEIIDRENGELNAQLIEELDPEEKCFIEQAVALLGQRRHTLFRGPDAFGGCDMLHRNLNDVEDSFSEMSLDTNVASVENDSFNNEDKFEKSSIIPNEVPSASTTKCHYFYQAADGQHIYLHSINAKMLEHTYGSLEFGPKTLTGKIVEKGGGSMTEELRRRLRYLQHLPLTCQFEVAEIQLRQPVVTKETLEYYQEQLEMRKKTRQRRAKEEKRREKRIEAEDNRKMGKYPMVDIHLESHLQFPEFGAEPKPRTESECTTQSDTSSTVDLTTYGSRFSSLASGSIESAYAGPSFATMLATEKKSLPAWPGLSSPKTSSVNISNSTPVKLITVTGTKMTPTTKKLRHSSDSDRDEPDDYEPVPDFHQSFVNSLAQALLNNEKDSNGDEPVTDADVVKKGKKNKKKNKQKVLFKTGINYNEKLF